MLEEPINLMRQIYEMLDQYTPDYDVEKIYKGLLEKQYCRYDKIGLKLVQLKTLFVSC